MKKAIVLGASSGIGNELAKLLVDVGYKVGVTGRNEDLLSKLTEYNKENLICSVFDITDFKLSIEKINNLIIELGGVDLVVFCAGAGDLNENLDFRIEKETININVLGFTNMVTSFYNYFEAQCFGHIVTISSVGGLRGSRFAPAYNASKSYQMIYLEGLRQKSYHSSKNIIVTDIRPGFVDTKMAKGDGLFWVMPVKKIAKQILVGIKNKSAVVYVSKRWAIIGYILKFMPKIMHQKM